MRASLRDVSLPDPLATRREWSPAAGDAVFPY